MPDAVIIDAIRTPSGRGKNGGALSRIHPVDLLSGVLGLLVERSALDPALIDDVIGGCVAQIGRQSSNVTRMAVLAAGFPESVPAVTIDRQCGSSQQAVAFAAQAIVAGSADIVIACGVESMSSNPIGASIGGEDPFGRALAERYPDGLVGQGVAAELVAAQWGLGREELDVFSTRSHRLAAEAERQGRFAREIVPVRMPAGSEHDANGSDADRLPFRHDETIRANTTVEGLATLSPAFRTDALAARFPEIEWRITPGNSSPLTDGASAALLMSAERASALGLVPRARIHSQVVTGSDPLLMLTGILPATRRILDRSGLSLDEIAAYEVNEAFAPVPLAWLREFGADPDRLNARGGAIALGHPLGASGTRLLTTLLNTLEDSGGRFGLQLMCEGGGMANATIIERL